MQATSPATRQSMSESYNGRLLYREEKTIDEAGDRLAIQKGYGGNSRQGHCFRSV